MADQPIKTRAIVRMGRDNLCFGLVIDKTFDIFYHKQKMNCNMKSLCEDSLSGFFEKYGQNGAISKSKVFIL